MEPRSSRSDQEEPCTQDGQQEVRECEELREGRAQFSGCKRSLQMERFSVSQGMGKVLLSFWLHLTSFCRLLR